MKNIIFFLITLIVLLFCGCKGYDFDVTDSEWVDSFSIIKFNNPEYKENLSYCYKLRIIDCPFIAKAMQDNNVYWELHENFLVQKFPLYNMFILTPTQYKWSDISKSCDFFDCLSNDGYNVFQQEIDKGGYTDFGFFLYYGNVPKDMHCYEANEGVAYTLSFEKFIEYIQYYGYYYNKTAILGMFNASRNYNFNQQIGDGDFEDIEYNNMIPAEKVSFICENREMPCTLKGYIGDEDNEDVKMLTVREQREMCIEILNKMIDENIIQEKYEDGLLSKIVFNDILAEKK